MDEMIEVRDLKKTFRTPFRRKKVEAVRQVSLSVRRGEIFGFLGPNGAGKTTTIKVLTGLVRPTAGTVRILGGAPDDIAVKARIGYLPEQPYFYDYLKPAELLDVFGRIFGIPAAERSRRIAALLDRVGIAYAKDRTLRKFSKGMLQRVGIAQALLNEPELVLLDEPMSGLDPIGRKEVADLILELRAKGTTVFFSSHILTDVERLCDRVAILDKGLLKASGSLVDLLGGGGDRKEIVLSGGDPAALAGEGVGPVEAVAAGVHRVQCEVAVTEALLARALAAGCRVVSVAERRLTLEQVVLGPSGPAAPGGAA